MKKPVILIATILSIVLVVFVALNKVQSLFSESPTDKITPTPIIEEEMTKLKEDEVVVDLTIRFDKQAAIIKATKLPNDVKTITYELVYDADTKSGESKTSGINGTVSNYVSGEKTFLTQATLGTCSKNVCVFDQNPRNFKLKLVFKQSSGEKVYWEKSF